MVSSMASEFTSLIRTPPPSAIGMAESSGNAVLTNSSTDPSNHLDRPPPSQISLRPPSWLRQVSRGNYSYTEIAGLDVIDEEGFKVGEVKRFRDFHEGRLLCERYDYGEVDPAYLTVNDVERHEAECRRRSVYWRGTCGCNTVNWSWRASAGMSPIEYGNNIPRAFGAATAIDEERSAMLSRVDFSHMGGQLD